MAEHLYPYPDFVAALRQGLAPRKGREFVEAAIEALWDTFSVATYRLTIARAAGRTLLGVKETEELLSRYRDFYEEGEERLIRKIPAIWYGEGWNQGWYLLRNVVVATREARRAMRQHRRLLMRCVICGAPRKDVRYCFSDYQWERAIANERFLEEITRKHFTTPCWELKLRGGVVESRVDSYWRNHLLEQYRYAIRPGGSLLGATCGQLCEATRFSRWLGVREMERREREKSENRYRKESEWIQRGKVLLRETRELLNPRASSSPRVASTRESNLRAS